MLVLKGDEPNALIVHLDKSLIESEQSLKPALAASLFKDGTLSLGGATRLSGMSMRSFVQFLAELGIDVVRPDETSGLETRDISAWLSS